MKRRDIVVSFVSGCVATGLAGFLAIDLDAQKILFDPVTAVHACAASDGTLRMVEMSADCPAGQQSLFFKKANADADVNDQTQQKPKPGSDTNKPSTDTQRLADLEQKIRELEGQANKGELARKVVAPFEVVDRSGRLIFDVVKEESGPQVRLYDSSVQPVVGLAATSKGGQISAGNPSGQATYVGIFSDGAGLRVRDATGGTSQPRIDLGNQNGKPYHLKIFGGSGNSIAGIGENLAGTGTVQVADAGGQVKATVGVSQNGSGAFTLYNGSNIIGNLTQGDFGGGLLVLFGSGGGKPMVAAGTTASGIGLVQVGPNGFEAGLGVLGLPGSFIAGKQ